MDNTKNLLRLILLVLAITSATRAIELNSIVGCAFGSDLSVNTGFRANFYDYPCIYSEGYCQSESYQQSIHGSEFYASQYTSSFYSSTNGVVDPNWFTTVSYSQTIGTILGVEITPFNFTLELTGYFYGKY